MLSSDARQAIEDPLNRLFVSSVAPWELAIKLRQGKLDLPVDLATFATSVIANLHAEILPVSLRHSTSIIELPPLHRDPFDRMLVAQAHVEGLAIVTSDRHLSRYGVRVIW
jgi:PIN domain nuclease of toxin-antitoxin system